MTQTPGREYTDNWLASSTEDAVAWSSQELEAEIARTAADLHAARILERAAKRRNDGEKMLETEVAYEGRRAEVNHIRRRYERLLEELEHRNGADLG